MIDLTNENPYKKCKYVVSYEAKVNIPKIQPHEIRRQSHKTVEIKHLRRSKKQRHILDDNSCRKSRHLAKSICFTLMSLEVVNRNLIGLSTLKCINAMQHLLSVKCIWRKPKKRKQKQTSEKFINTSVFSNKNEQIRQKIYQDDRNCILEHEPVLQV